MSNENNKPAEKPSAAQRLSDLELAAAQLYHATDLMGRDLGLLKNAFKLLNNKVDAIVKATVSGEEITDEVLNRIMIENNVADLANRVANMIVNGTVVPEEQVTANSFIVGAEVEDDGKVSNPRIQFAVKALTPELQAKLIGAKAGDSFKFKEGELSFKLLETYKIQEPPAPEAAPEASADEAAPEAPQIQLDTAVTADTQEAPKAG